MPKLTADQIIARLQGRIEQLEAGEEIAKKDIHALLNEAQQRALEDALAAQVQLKQQKRARSDEEKKALGWKTIREVRLEILKQALDKAHNGIVDAYSDMQRATELRQMKIYMAAINERLAKGYDMQSAKIWANNELTRANLPRLDEQKKVAHGMSERDKEVRAMEAALLKKFRAEMTPEEIEQERLLENLEMQERKRIADAIKGRK